MSDFPGRRWIAWRECAKYLGLHEMSVRKMINRGTIPAVHIGRAIRVDLRQLEAKLEAQTTAVEKRGLQGPWS